MADKTVPTERPGKASRPTGSNTLQAVCKLARKGVDQVLTQRELALQDQLSADRVHELRVSIRRLRTCLEEYPALFDRKAARKATGRLRKAFKLAGRVRDFDIALELTVGMGMHANTRVVRVLKQMRRSSSERLHQHLAESSADPFRVEDLREGLNGSSRKKQKRDSPASRSFRNSNGHPAWISKGLLKSGRRLLNGNGSVQRLHKLRLKVKKRRYVLEVVQPRLKEITKGLRILKQLQSELGSINDCRTTIELLQSSQLVDLPRASELLERLRDLESKQAEAFRQSWSARFSKWV